MKLPIISTATILLMSFITANSAIAQTERITCLRDQNLISCPGSPSFNYRAETNNSNLNPISPLVTQPLKITCFREQNLISCPGYTSFEVPVGK